MFITSTIITLSRIRTSIFFYRQQWRVSHHHLIRACSLNFIGKQDRKYFPSECWFFPLEVWTVACKCGIEIESTMKNGIKLGNGIALKYINTLLGGIVVLDNICVSDIHSHERVSEAHRVTNERDYSRFPASQNTLGVAITLFKFNIKNSLLLAHFNWIPMKVKLNLGVDMGRCRLWMQEANEMGFQRKSCTIFRCGIWFKTERNAIAWIQVLNRKIYANTILFKWNGSNMLHL